MNELNRRLFSEQEDRQRAEREIGSPFSDGRTTRDDVELFLHSLESKD